MLGDDHDDPCEPETFTMPVGTLVHFCGIPFRLTADTVVEGSSEAFAREQGWRERVIAYPGPPPNNGRFPD